MKWKKQSVQEFLLLNLGTVLICLGVYFFKFPNNFSIGGVSGMAVIIARYTQAISQATVMTIINMVLLLLGFLVFGRSFGFKTAYSTVLMSVVTQALEWLFPMEKPFTSQPVLELFFAILLPAIGSALLFNIDASSGGTDIVAMVLKKYTSLNIGRALMLSDLVITLAACVAFGMETGLFSITGLLLKSLVIDYVIESINMCKYFTIVCEKPEEICRYIQQSLGHSATVVEAKGAYSGQQKYLVLTVIRRYEAVQLRRTVKLLDPVAFMMITNTSEIIGKGFRGVN
ncbi:MAG TPA: YitT family protein [Candidatus Merdivicinus faecavium]|nr:YitT family protein [Candidatus Merdivicinus faecavium]